METASSHFIPELVGSCISTTLIAIGTFFLNWKGRLRHSGCYRFLFSS